MQLVRRDFVAAMTAGTVGALAGTSLSVSSVPAFADEAASVSDSASQLMDAAYDALSEDAIEQVSCDVVVIGAGPAGMSAAITAAENGLTAVVLEKTSVSGGCAKYGMGPLAIGSKYQEEQGIDLDLAQMLAEFSEYTHFRTNLPLVQEYFSRSNETLEWLNDMGVEFDEAARYFEKSYPTWHLVHSEDGVVGGGQASTMTEHLQARAEELGVTFYFETPACKLEVEDGVLKGVCAVAADGSTGYHFDTTAAVVATGGFGNNEVMVAKQFGLTLKQDFFGMQFPGHEGDGVNMVWQVGGKKSVMIEEMIYDIYRPNTEGSYTSDIKLVMQQGNLIVNQQGKRFFNEEQVQNTTYTGNALCHQTGNTGFAIVDEDIKAGYVADNAVPFTSKVWNCDDFSQFDANFAEMEASGYNAIVRADTLEELAEKLGIDAEGLTTTIDEYNAACEAGVDPLGKSAEYLKPIKTAPFYGAQFFPSSYGTLGGIWVDEELQVMGTDDKPIAGLFSAGTDSCTVYGDSYMFLLPGNTMGYSINTGRFAGESVTAYLA